MYSSPRLHDSTKLNVVFKINTVMTMLVRELGKGHAALQKFQTVLGLNNMHLKTFQRHNRKVHQACQSVADISLDTATEVIRGAFGDLMDDAGVIDRPGKQPTLLATKTLMGLRRRWKLRQRDEYGPDLWRSTRSGIQPFSVTVTLVHLPPLPSWSHMGRSMSSSSSTA